MKLIHWLALFLLFYFPLYGGFDNPAFSARSAALANGYPASTAGRDGFLINPALSSYASGFYAALSHSRLYGLKELQYAGGTVVHPVGPFGAAFSIENLGSSLYRETSLTLNTSKSFLNNYLSVGFSLHYYQISVAHYGNSSAAALSLGCQYRVLENLYIGAALTNINRPALNGYRDEIPQVTRLGLQYQNSSTFITHLSIEKDSWYPPEVTIAAEYIMYKGLALRSGFSSEISRPSLGIMLHVSRIEIDYALQHHFELGNTHFIGIAFRS